MNIFLQAAHRFARWAATMTRKTEIYLEWTITTRTLKKNRDLYSLYANFKKDPEAKWSISKDDAVKLFEVVTKDHPRHVLELGTGVGLSTAIIAHALKKIGTGHITSLEQSKHCTNVAQRLIPKELKKHITIIHARPAIMRMHDVAPWTYFCGYDWLPEKSSIYDFIFIDGPASWTENGRVVSLNGGDIFRLIPFLAENGKVYIDGRRSLVRLIERYLYNHLRIVEQTDNLTIFKMISKRPRSFNEVRIQDIKTQDAAANAYEEADAQQIHLSHDTPLDS